MRIFRVRIEENKEALREMWSVVPESIIYELWRSKAWEMQAFDKIECVKDCVWLTDFNLRYLWYFSLENFGS